MKIVIFKNIPPKNLIKRLPNAYQGKALLYLSKNKKHELFSVIYFSGDRSILLGTAKKGFALIPLDSTGKLVAIGYCFTRESHDLWKAKNIDVIEKSEFEWTDEKYQEIRVLIARRGKPK